MASLGAETCVREPSIKLSCGNQNPTSSRLSTSAPDVVCVVSHPYFLFCGSLLGNHQLSATWVNAGHTKGRVWTDTSVLTRKAAFVKGSQLASVHPAVKEDA
ncbi:hypothetical protein HPB52_012501 [Rhipicephalus sanguineus]|uniref:Uncharacterized protein n=1 Tax=Rhipicephalus sanguineus TaxID=34632 RepID=A0A9D4T3X4_RHISA|nr:hypothetical protein HPB52_012501 [Rhipicephalus sanguineus]